ncbi:MAG: presqualene diphosphate synthase HpnD [Verrucomicrobia bacterium]|nr:presqualene diphosphate synthase HpnD [Verrucomicrobiota bacterium]
MSVSVQESYRLCCQLARKAGTNFYVSFLAMPKAKREAMCVVYAFMRHSDDIADDATSPSAATEGLRAWREQVAAALNGKETSEPILPALAEVVRRFGIERRYLFELLDGTEMDQTKTRFATFDELYQYCYRVASCVGLVVMPIFGYTDQAALVPAEACGIAFQLTNILRDVKEDAEKGRIYLPAEDMRRFGVEDDDIMKSRYTPQFVELMRFEASRAREYYAKARPLLGMISADSRGTLAVMMDVYGGLLDRIEARQFRVFDGRVRLSGAEKLWIVLKNWRRQ